MKICIASRIVEKTETISVTETAWTTVTERKSPREKSIAKKLIAPNAGKLRKVGCKSAHKAKERGNQRRDFISGEGARAQREATIARAARINPVTATKNNRLVTRIRIQKIVPLFLEVEWNALLLEG